MLIQKNIKFLIAQYEYCQKSHSIWPSLANYVHFPVELPVSNYLQYSLILQSKYFLDQCNLIILSQCIFVSWRYHLLLTALTIYNLYYWLICFHMPPVPRVPKHKMTWTNNNCEACFILVQRLGGLPYIWWNGHCGHLCFDNETISIWYGSQCIRQTR